MKQALDNGLVLRTAAGPEDIERVAVFNGLIHGPESVSYTHLTLPTSDLV